MTELEQIRLEIAAYKGFAWKYWFDDHAQKTLCAYYKPPFSTGAWYDNDGVLRFDPTNIPNWPADIAAAWELVIEVQAAGLAFDLFDIRDGKKIWFGVTLFDPPGGPMSEQYEAEGDTAALAICRAYLSWRKAQHD